MIKQCGAVRKFLTMFLPCHIRVLEWAYNLQLPGCQELLARNRRSIWHLSNCNENRSHNHLIRKQTLNCLAPLETHKNHLPFSCKRWMSTRLPKHEDIILNSMTQTREKRNFLILSRADFWMVWRCHGTPFFHFCFFV